MINDSPAPLWDDDEIIATLKRRQHHATLPNGWHIITLIAAAEIVRMVRDDERVAAAQREEALRQQRDELIESVKMAYRKHHLEDATIGWDELSEKLLDTLSNAMGVEELVKWQEDNHVN